MENLEKALTTNNIKLSTFTKDSLYGDFNSDLDWIRKKFENKMSELTNEYIKDCIKMNVEVSSVDGLIFSILFESMVISRIKCVDNKRKKGE